jgi:hypothetical protein
MSFQTLPAGVLKQFKNNLKTISTTPRTPQGQQNLLQTFLKNIFTSYANHHFEIAKYCNESLTAAMEKLSDNQHRHFRQLTTITTTDTQKPRTKLSY